MIALVLAFAAGRCPKITVAMDQLLAGSSPAERRTSLRASRKVTAWSSGTWVTTDITKGASFGRWTRAVGECAGDLYVEDVLCWRDGTNMSEEAARPRIWRQHPPYAAESSFARDTLRPAEVGWS